MGKQKTELDYTPDCSHEKEFFLKGVRSVGVDEVGRGCLAGPVVAAAVSFPDELLKEMIDDKNPDAWWRGLGDSKKLKAQTRKALSLEIQKHCEWSVAWCGVEEIDKLNILHASLKAMRKALEKFEGKCGAVLVDGNMTPYKAPHYDERAKPRFAHVVTLIKGDSRSYAIAAASIIAKVYRDEWMERLSQEYPHYELHVHKGYPTPLHKEKIRAHGICDLHRRSFSMPV